MLIRTHTQIASYMQLPVVASCMAEKDTKGTRTHKETRQLGFYTHGYAHVGTRIALCAIARRHAQAHSRPVFLKHNIVARARARVCVCVCVYLCRT